MKYKQIRLFGPGKKRVAKPKRKYDFENRRPHFITTPEEEQLIREDLEAGNSTYKLSQKYGYSRSVIRRIQSAY